MDVFSAKDEALVKESWEILKQNIPHHSLRLFSIIAERAPETRYMFSFLKDSKEMPLDNPRMRAHAVKIFKLTCESACQFREKGGDVVAAAYLKHLGSVHLSRGVADYQFEVVKEGLLITIKEAHGDKWSEEMKNAWTIAYDHLADSIKAHMKQADAQDS